MPVSLKNVSVVFFLQTCVVLSLAFNPATVVWGQDPPPITYKIPLYSQDSGGATNATTSGLSPIEDEQADLIAGVYRIGLYSVSTEVTVPSLKGLTWKEARQKLAELNLIAEKKNESGRAEDQVDYQNPAAGKTVSVGTPVGLRLVTKIPNVTGMTLEEAYDELKSAGFPAKYFTLWDKDYEVTGQIPKSGVQNIRGVNVKILCHVKTPKVVGMTVSEAKKALEEATLHTVLTTAYLDSDRILDQSFRPGAMIPRQSSVEIVPGVKVPDLVGLDSRTALLTLSKIGVRAQNKKTSYKETTNSLQHGQIFVDGQLERPGQFMPRSRNMSVSLTQMVFRQQPAPVLKFDPLPPQKSLDLNPVPKRRPQQVQKCPECGKPVSACRCFFNGG